MKNNRSNHNCRADRTLRRLSTPSNRTNLPRMPPQARQTTTATPQDCRVKPPRACAQSARIYIYIRGKSSRWGRRSAAPRQATPRTSTRLGRVAGAQTRRRKRGKSRHDRGGGHSRRCRHPKPPGINPAQQNAGLARQPPKNQQHHTPSAAPFSGMRRDIALP